MTSFSIQSFGCRVNQAEAFQWANTLQSHGWEFRKDSFQSDLVLVNTCTLTSRADSDVRGFIRKVSRLNPDARMVLTGCFVEKNAGMLCKNSQVWRIFPNEKKSELALSIVSALGKKGKTEIRAYRSRALVKIQDGCDFSCSFCIIPSVRGRSRSLDRAEVLRQIADFVAQGFREIVLTGIHINSYGEDLKPKRSLLDLLGEVKELDGLGRVRLSSLDPRLLDVSFLDQITSTRKICPHYHLSLQHASDDVLGRMGRKSREEEYRAFLSCLNRKAPLASLGADILVGFPGESESDFERLCCFLEESPLTYFHVFTYSPRPGTAAARWEQVDGKLSRLRASRLQKLSQKKNLDFRKRFLGEELEGIVIKKEIGNAQVLTSNYIKVHVPTCFEEKKADVVVRITEADEKKTLGEVV